MLNDEQALKYAARHDGLLTGPDALRLGLTRDQIRTRVRSGLWQRVGPNVYAIAGSPWTWQRTARAALLAGPATAVLSHATAAALWRVGPPSSVPHLTVPRIGSARVSGAHVHRSDVPAAERTKVGQLAVTTVARTLLDCAARATDEQICAMVDAAIDGHRTSIGAMQALFDGGGRRVGRAALLRAFRPWTDPIRPGSPAEARLLRRLDQWGFAPPVRQHVVRDASGLFVGRLDLAWTPTLVGVEYDGGAYHGPRRYEADEARHDALVALGWRIVHADRLDLRPGDERVRLELVNLLPQMFVQKTG